MSKRVFDVALASLLMLVLAAPLVLIALVIKLTSKGPAMYWSKRVGKGNRIFLMPKFRTMLVSTPQVATHLLADPQVYLTPVGGMLRKASLDELPQLYSILMGDMSFVGPRPALFNQDDLVGLRTQVGVHELVPGLTGWAQINGRDEISISQKVELDRQYLLQRSFMLDMKILLVTLVKALRGAEVAH